jgi:hypothetical protein
MQRRWYCQALTVGGLLAALLLARPASAAEPEFTPPKPGPEHEILKKLEGTWNATVKASMEPGKPPQESKGTMVYKMVCGGLWLSSEFEGEFGGQKFQGRGLDTYDTGKKKYTMVWVDSMATTPMIGEGSYDKEARTMTFTSDYPGPDGKLVKHKIVSKLIDDDNAEMKMSIPDKDGKDQVMMTITYKRKK